MPGIPAATCVNATALTPVQPVSETGTMDRTQWSVPSRPAAQRTHGRDADTP